MRSLAGVGALLLVLAACGGGGSDAKSTDTSKPAASSSTTSSLDSTPASAATGGSTTPVSVAPTHPAAHLVAVRAARQDTVDRVVFEFTEQVPGYKVSYVKKPILDTSGKEVPLSDNFVLQFHLQQATGFNLDSGQPTYTGPKRLQPAGTRAVGEVAQVEDFEGTLTWVAGLNAELPFRVSTLTGPPRLVIDIPS
jgi:hypothetical protein